MRGNEKTCSSCNGKGYIEYEAGLIRLPCLDCEGNGVIFVPYKTVKEIFKGEADDRGAGRAYTDDGGEDTGKPTKPRKRKTRKKARA